MSLGSAIALGVLSHAVAKRETAGVDGDVLEATPADNRKVRAAAKSYPLGKWWFYVPAATMVAA